MDTDERILVEYQSSLRISDELCIRLQIPNHFGFVKDAKALFNMNGERPGDDGCCYLIYDEQESTDRVSVFKGKTHFANIGYRTFFIKLKLNNDERTLTYDEDKEEVVITKEDIYEFWKVFVYYSAYEPPNWVKGGIMYQIFVDTFCREGELPEALKDKVVDWGTFPKWQPDSDGVYRNTQFYGGNLKGIIKKLDYIKKLNVTVIYLTPILKSPSSNRYDTEDFEKIDEMVGTWEDLAKLHEEANRRGISIVIDCVFNHSSNQNRMLYECPDMYDWIKKYTKPKCWWGYEHLVEFNKYHEAYFNNLTRWLELYSQHVDGIRLDVADNLPDFVLKYIKRCFKKYVLGEVWKNAITGEFRDFLCGDELDGVMNYKFANAIYRYVRWGMHKYFKQIVGGIADLYPPDALAVSPIFLSSHDIPRIPNILVGDHMRADPHFENVWDMEKDNVWFNGAIFDTYRFRKWEVDNDKIPESKKELARELQKIAVFLQYTLPGIPSIFAGDEAGTTGFKDPTNRKSFPWDNIDKIAFKLYETLGEFRISNREIFAANNFEIVEAAESYLIYKRGEILFIINRTAKVLHMEKYKNKKIVFSFEESKINEGVISPYEVLALK